MKKAKTYIVRLGDLTVNQMREQCVQCTDCGACSIEAVCTGSLGLASMTNEDMDTEIELLTPYKHKTVEFKGKKFSTISEAIATNLVDNRLIVFMLPKVKGEYKFDLMKKISKADLDTSVRSIAREYKLSLPYDAKDVKIEYIVDSKVL